MRASTHGAHGYTFPVCHVVGRQRYGGGRISG
jgi:hypothetical protein